MTTLLERATVLLTQLTKKINDNSYCVSYDEIATGIVSLSEDVQTRCGSSYLLRLNRDLIDKSLMYKKEKTIIFILMNNLVLLLRLINDEMVRGLTRA